MDKEEFRNISYEEATLRSKVKLAEFVHEIATSNKAVHGAMCIFDHGETFSMIQVGDRSSIIDMSRAVALEGYRTAGSRALLLKIAWPVHALVFSLGVLLGVYINF